MKKNLYIYLEEQKKWNMSKTKAFMNNFKTKDSEQHSHWSFLDYSKATIPASHRHELHKLMCQDYKDGITLHLTERCSTENIKYFLCCEK